MSTAHVGTSFSQAKESVNSHIAQSSTDQDLEPTFRVRASHYPMTKRLTTLETGRDRHRCTCSEDAWFIFSFIVFAVTSLVFEMYIVFDYDFYAGLEKSFTEDPFAYLWVLYASRWDPIFMKTPLFLKIMCGIDAFVFGPFYLVLIYAFVKRRNWIRIPGLMYVSAIVYSTVVYFAVEFIGERERSDLCMVFIINIPYTIVPLLLGWRLRHPTVFPSSTTRKNKHS